jgi:adenine-specific DNA methylase
MIQKYPKRLIEVDLPIKRISLHAKREKDMRRGHIPLLHIYPAARPPAACRAVMCAALWPDPADPLCPQRFREEACRLINEFAQKAVAERELGTTCDPATWLRWQSLVRNGGLDPRNQAHHNVLRYGLLDFIADFANWDNSTAQDYLDIARNLTRAAHESLDAGSGSIRPLVVDSFAGGGAIPLEAARLGTDTFASDTSPVAVLLNKVILELVPTYKRDLFVEVEKQITEIKKSAEKILGNLYPIDADGQVPTTYLWARTVRCEGPGCGATIPLIRSPRIVRKGSRALYLRLVPTPNRKAILIEFTDTLTERADAMGTVKRGAAICPICGYTTAVESVRGQLIERQGGTHDAQLLAVVTTRPGEQGRTYRPPTVQDLRTIDLAREELGKLSPFVDPIRLDASPTEYISLNEIRRISVPLYGLTRWADLFTPRQLVALTTFCHLVREAGERVRKSRGEAFGRAVQVCLGLLLDKLADMNTSLCVWQSHAEIPAHIFGRWAIGMVFDFAETNPLAKSSGSPESSGKRLLEGLEVVLAAQPTAGHAELGDATQHALPNDSVQLFMVDPPYYDAIPYAHLMDFFYVWLRRSIGDIMPDLFSTSVSRKDSEIVVDRPHHLSTSKKDVAFYERELQRAFTDGLRILQSGGIAVVVFASKSTASWEAILKAIVNAGWVITGSWPLDTEMESRVAAQGQARLASSVHLVCRPRVKSDGSLEPEGIGDWRDVLEELPRRIHEWMPRLASEGVVGADAIFACLGPALEVFSRYSRVEKASGDAVALGEYLEHVWAAVAKEALAMVFEGADATGFEADARLTAMWLWTLNAPDSNGNAEGGDDDEGSEDEQEGKKPKISGFKLEYDAARKIAQGLGAHLETLTHLVQVSGDQARLLPVSERTKHLFGKDEEEPTRAAGKKKSSAQLNMFAELTEGEDAEAAWKEKTVKRVGETTLDRVHQAMILFAAGRSEALKRFVVDDGVGQDGKFWRLADALNALYPTGSDERRWVEGVLARKKQFGF